MIRSLYDQYLTSGALPRWSLWNTTPNYMNGDPAIQTIADGMCRGVLDGLDLAALYRAMRKLAFDQRRPDYLKKGYIPREAASKAASDTLEYGDADFALALMAQSLGHGADAAVLARRSGAWQHQFDPKTRYIRPRNANGSFPADWDPSSDEGWKEGSGWQYLWLVPHDVAALSHAIGGAAATRDRLDSFFSTPATSPAAAPVVPAAQNTVNVFGLQYRTTQYSPGNEHDLHAPYLYDYVGAPAKTQAVVAAERSLFNDTPYGLPGNDDLGSLSAWYVWTALGFYPVTQGAPVAAIGTPLFAHTELATPEGALVTDAPGVSPVAKYIGGVKFSGRVLNRAWLGRDALVRGGRLSFTMSPTATTWASGPGGAPPSLSTTGLRGFGCRP
jgi:predicted alpha-1,2-mannosidase